VLERRHSGAAGGERIDLAKVSGDGEAQCGRLVQQWLQQVGRELRVDLDVVRARYGAQVHRPAHLGAVRTAVAVG